MEKLRRGKNVQSDRSRNQAEKRFLEASTKLETLIESLHRDRIEKKIDEAKEELNKTGKEFLALATRIRLVAEKIEVNQYISKIDELMHRVEEGGEIQLKKFDSLKSLSEIDCADRKNAESILNDINQDAIELFSRALVDLEHLGHDVARFSIEQVRQKLKVFRKEFPERVSQLALVARAVKVDKRLSREVYDLGDYIADAEINLLAETDELNQLLATSEANDENVLNELSRILDKEKNYCHSVIEELHRLYSEIKPFIERKKRKHRVGTFLETLCMIACNIFLYVNWSYQEKMILQVGMKQLPGF